MTVLYARTTGGDWNTIGTWSTSSGGASSGTVPTAADEVKLDANSGNVSIATAAVCRSLDCTGYTGTLSHTAGSFTIGDATAGTGNVALKFSSTMTFSGFFGGGIVFASTSATQQTIDGQGKTSADSLTINGVGSSYKLISAWAGGSLTNFVVTNGTIDFNGQTISAGVLTSSNANTRTIIWNGATFNIQGASGTLINFATTTGLTFTMDNAAVCNIQGSTGSAKTLAFGGLTWGQVRWPNASGVGVYTITGGGTFYKFGNTGALTQALNVAFTSGITITITGGLHSSFFFGGASGFLLTITAVTAGTPFTVASPIALYMDWTSLKDCTGATNTRHYAGANSTNVSGNTNWNFAAGPADPDEAPRKQLRPVAAMMATR